MEKILVLNVKEHENILTERKNFAMTFTKYIQDICRCTGNGIKIKSPDQTITYEQAKTIKLSVEKVIKKITSVNLFPHLLSPKDYKNAPSINRTNEYEEHYFAVDMAPQIVTDYFGVYVTGEDFVHMRTQDLRALVCIWGFTYKAATKEILIIKIMKSYTEMTHSPNNKWLPLPMVIIQKIFERCCMKKTVPFIGNLIFRFLQGSTNYFDKRLLEFYNKKVVTTDLRPTCYKLLANPPFNLLPKYKDCINNPLFTIIFNHGDWTKNEKEKENILVQDLSLSIPRDEIVLMSMSRQLKQSRNTLVVPLYNLINIGVDELKISLKICGVSKPTFSSRISGIVKYAGYLRGRIISEDDYTRLTGEIFSSIVGFKSDVKKNLCRAYNCDLFTLTSSILEFDYLMAKDYTARKISFPSLGDRNFDEILIPDFPHNGLIPDKYLTEEGVRTVLNSYFNFIPEQFHVDNHTGEQNDIMLWPKPSDFASYVKVPQLAILANKVKISPKNPITRPIFQLPNVITLNIANKNPGKQEAEYAPNIKELVKRINKNTDPKDLLHPKLLIKENISYLKSPVLLKELEKFFWTIFTEEETEETEDIRESPVVSPVLSPFMSAVEIPMLGSPIPTIENQEPIVNKKTKINKVKKRTRLTLIAAYCGIDMRHIEKYSISNNDAGIFTRVLIYLACAKTHRVNNSPVPTKYSRRNNEGPVKIYSIDELFQVAYSGKTVEISDLDKNAINRSYSGFGTTQTHSRRRAQMSVLKRMTNEIANNIPIIPSDVYRQLLECNFDTLKKMAYHYTKGDLGVLIMNKPQLVYLLSRGSYPRMISKRLHQARQRMSEFYRLNEIQLGMICTLHLCHNVDKLLYKEKTPLEQLIIDYGRKNIKVLMKSVGMISPPGEDKNDYYLNTLNHYQRTINRDPTLVRSNKGKLSLMAMNAMTDYELFGFFNTYIPYSSRIDLISKLFTGQYSPRFFVPLVRTIIKEEEKNTPLLLEDSLDPKTFVFGYGTIIGPSKSLGKTEKSRNWYMTPEELNYSFTWVDPKGTKIQNLLEYFKKNPTTLPVQVETTQIGTNYLTDETTYLNEIRNVLENEATLDITPEELNNIIDHIRIHGVVGLEFEVVNDDEELMATLLSLEEARNANIAAQTQEGPTATTTTKVIETPAVTKVNIPSPIQLAAMGFTFDFSRCFGQGDHPITDINDLKKLAGIYISSSEELPTLITVIEEGLKAKIKTGEEERKIIVKFGTFPNKEKQLIKEWLLKLFEAGMYMRRWKGPGNKYPHGVAETTVKIDPTLNVTQAYIRLEDVFGKMSKPTQIFVKNLSIVLFRNQEFKLEKTKIGLMIDRVKAGKKCIRQASSRFVGTGNRYLTTFFGVTIPNFDPSKVANIW